MQLSIILPARNEELLMKETLTNIVNYLVKKEIYDYEILVVINGTNDKTTTIVSENIFKNRKIKILRSQAGYGKALKAGFKNAKGKYIIVFNVDFYDLKLIDLINVDLYGKDFIIGSKMTNWSVDKRPYIRRMISRLFNYYLKIVYNFEGSDTHGIKIMKNGVVKNIFPKCKTDSGIFDTEFVLRSQYAGYKFADFPVVIEEIRPPRFKQRVLQTPKDLIELGRALKDLS